MSDMMNGGPPRPPNNDYGEGLGPNGGLGGGPEKGENAIDCILHDPITGSGIQLSELWVQSNGYLCISFGSCSCNMFRGAHMDFEELAQKYSNRGGSSSGSSVHVEFLSIYISEAHPKDGWSFGEENGRWDINQAKTLKQRRKDCRTWQSSFNGKLCL
jgi:hypothetical protein